MQSLTCRTGTLCGMGEGLPETSSHYHAAHCHDAHWSAQPPESQQCLHGRRREGGLTGAVVVYAMQGC